MEAWNNHLHPLQAVSGCRWFKTVTGTLFPQNEYRPPNGLTVSCASFAAAPSFCFQPGIFAAASHGKNP